MISALPALLTTALLATPFSAATQDASASEDWTLTRIADKDTVIASMPFSNGVTLVARCSNNVFDVLLLGLPEARRGELTRQLTLLIGDETDATAYAWTVGSERSVAFSRAPAITARSLAKGGKLQIIVPARGDTPRSRYVMELGPSGSAIEEP